MINVWGKIKWLWKFSPVAWLFLFSVLAIVLAGVVFSGFAVFMTVVILLMAWLVGLGIDAVWERYDEDIKYHCREWWKDRP